MAVPKRRTSKSVTRQRRNHKRLSFPNFSECKNCQALILSHRACYACGHYKGKEIIKLTKE